LIWAEWTLILTSNELIIFRNQNDIENESSLLIKDAITKNVSDIVAWENSIEISSKYGTFTLSFYSKEELAKWEAELQALVY